jgi:hypothetical protein
VAIRVRATCVLEDRFLDQFEGTRKRTTVARFGLRSTTARNQREQTDADRNAHRLQTIPHIPHLGRKFSSSNRLAHIPAASLLQSGRFSEAKKPRGLETNGGSAVDFPTDWTGL